MSTPAKHVDVTIMKVFDLLSMPPDIYEHLSEEMSNGSYRRVYVDGRKLYSSDPEMEAKAVAWLLDNGAEPEDGVVLVYISW